MSTTEPTRPRWLVAFTDSPYAMRIVAVEPAPEDPEALAELVIEMFVNCLSTYQVEAASSVEARRTARQLHDVERIRTVCERRHALRARRRTTPAFRHINEVLDTATQALTHAAQDLDLNGPAIRYADALATSALRAGYQHRTWRQRELTFEQYIGELAHSAASTLFRSAALAADGRHEEAMGLLVNTLAAASSDL